MALDPKASLFAARTTAEPLRPGHARAEAELDQAAKKVTREGRTGKGRVGGPSQLNAKLSQPWHYELVAEMIEYLDELKTRPGGKLSQGDFMLLAIRGELDRRKAADSKNK